MRYLLVGAAALAAGVVAAAAVSDPNYHFERSIDIDANPEDVCDTLSDLEQFTLWSPWDKMDPKMQKTFSETTRGEGATYAWKGNNKVGEGQMTILKVEPERRVDVKLEFIKPFPSVCRVSWSVQPQQDGSRVTWSMDGRNESLMPKLFHLLMNMDKMIGKDFDRGLADLKALCEN